MVVEEGRSLDERITDIGSGGFWFALIDRIGRERLDEIIESRYIIGNRRKDEGLARENNESKMAKGIHGIMEESFRVFYTRREEIISFHGFRNIEDDDPCAIRWNDDGWSTVRTVEDEDDEDANEREENGTYRPEDEEEWGSGGILFHERVREGIPDFFTKKNHPHYHTKSDEYPVKEADTERSEQEEGSNIHEREYTREMSVCKKSWKYGKE